MLKLPEGTHLGIFDDVPLFHPFMVILGRFINGILPEKLNNRPAISRGLEDEFPLLLRATFRAYVH